MLERSHAPSFEKRAYFDQGISGGWTVPFMLSLKIEMLGNLS